MALPCPEGCELGSKRLVEFSKRCLRLEAVGRCGVLAFAGVESKATKPVVSVAAGSNVEVGRERG